MCLSPYLVEILLKTSAYCHAIGHLDVFHYGILYFESVVHFLGYGNVENQKFLGYGTAENQKFLGYGTAENQKFLGYGTDGNQSVWDETQRCSVQVT
jgi:hypothetical protein